MAVTRSSSAKKVVHKAVAVKITRLSSSATVKATREYLTWDERFAQLVDYKNEHGHCNPKQNTKLGLWCMNQRNFFKENKLRHYQMNELASIAFQFSLSLKARKKYGTWDDRFAELVAFKNKQVMPVLYLQLH